MILKLSERRMGLGGDGCLYFDGELLHRAHPSSSSSPAEDASEVEIALELISWQVLRTLPRPELHQCLHVLRDECTGRSEHEYPIRPPLIIEEAGADLRILKGIGPNVDEHRDPQR